MSRDAQCCTSRLNLNGVFDRGQQGFDIWWHVATPDHRRPDLDRRTGNERLIQPNVAEVIVQMRASSTVQGVTGCPNAWPALAPRTCAPKVPPTLIGQEHICPMIQPLKSPLQLAGTTSEGHQIGVVGYRDQQVDILGRRLRRHDRADERDAANANQRRDRTHESHNAGQHLLANRVPGRLVRHDLRQRPEEFFPLDRLEALIRRQPMINGLPTVSVPKVGQVEAATTRVLQPCGRHDEFFRRFWRAIADTPVVRLPTPLREDRHRVVEGMLPHSRRTRQKRLEFSGKEFVPSTRHFPTDLVRERIAFRPRAGSGRSFVRHCLVRGSAV